MRVMPKVTESLRRQWALQRAQMIEEREFTQRGEPRDELGVMEVDHDVAALGKLLALPMGATFNALQISDEVAQERRLPNNARRREQ